jgi:glutamate dehydrogenase
MAHLGIKPAATTASLQGFGNVSQYAAIGFSEILGGKVLAVSSWDHQDNTSYTFFKKDGIDAAFLQSITDIYGSIDKEKAKQAGYSVEPRDAWLDKEVDVLIPAAIEGQITGETVKRIKGSVKILAEGANGPTTPEADAELKKRGTFVIPDFLCNGGGVTVSYFESVQNDMNYYWSREDVLARLDEKMRSAFRAVLDVSTSKKVYMRDAAYMVAIDRVVHAMQFRGWL